MRRKTAQAWSTGLNAAGFIANLLSSLYSGYQQDKARTQGAERFGEWQGSMMTPSQATPTGEPVEIENPLGGGSMNIPTFETTPPQMGPVDAQALTRLYATMAGLPQDVSSPYMNLGRDLYGVNAQEQSQASARARELEDRDYDRTVNEQDRAFKARLGVAGAMEKDYDVSDPAGYLNFLTSGEGDLAGSLKPSDDIKALGVVEGKEGVMIPYQRNGEFGATTLKADGLTLRDPNPPRGGGGTSGAMTMPQQAALSRAYEDRRTAQAAADAARAELNDITNMEATLSSLPSTSLMPGEPSPREKRAMEIEQKKRKAMERLRAAEGSARSIDASIRTWETGQVQRETPFVAGGDQPAPAPSVRNPYMD